MEDAAAELGSPNFVSDPGGKREKKKKKATPERAKKV